jgi:uncharacterized Zn finger protein (UPF0148 family)
MSDFDKEKEREKLREKYERDEEKRETAEKMSELLLQGATMTNAHCSECGDPIFRYDGQEFCATCEKPVQRDTGDAEEDASGEAESAKSESGEAGGEDTTEGGQHIEVTDPSDDARVAFGAEAGDDAEEGSEEAAGQHPDRGGQASEERRAPASQSAQSRQPPEARAGESAQSRQERPGAADASTRQVPGLDPGGEGDVSSARESLVRTLTRFSQQAEATEDPQRASEYLSAAREAAEALAALRR